MTRRPPTDDRFDFDAINPIRIACGPGLAETVVEELEALGYEPLDRQRAGVDLKGTFADAMRLNLHLRTALHVLYELKAFRCHDADTLYDEVRSVAWEDLIEPDGYLCVTSHVDHPSINNSMFPNLRVKDAIVDRMNDRLGRRPDSGPERDRFVVGLSWMGDRAWLSINTSGRKLSDRGYRKIPHVAPMKETLAAAVIMATGYTGEQPLVNPMCGSGTLAIEAALIGLGRAPGLLRSNFGLMHVKGYPEALWREMRREAKNAGRKALGARIIASDIDPDAIDAARRNATTAGVDHLIDFHVCDFALTPLPDEPGLVIFNPAYGERLDDLSGLEATYRRIGDFFKQRCAGSTGFVFTGNLDLGKRVGLKPSRRIPFFNAHIECRLYRYELYDGSRRTTPE
ncbi:MAG: hypothetical protein KDA25_10190 [Phycisphaerales bacterium]|nr:hypothetical protein [Phycisphaerales bacterium]